MMQWGTLCVSFVATPLKMPCISFTGGFSAVVLFLNILFHLCVALGLHVARLPTVLNHMCRGVVEVCG